VFLVDFDPSLTTPHPEQKGEQKQPTMNPAKKLLNTSLLLSLLVFRFCISLDTISPNEPVKDGDILVSKGETFALGFFSPGNSGRRYVGIWYYKVPEQTIVWVANRDNPLNDTTGVLSINGHGNLVLNSKNRSTPIWSTNASVSSPNNSMAQLLDSGNLVLVLPNSQRVSISWQSFDYPTNTLLASMKLGLDRRTGLNRSLTSWKSEDDPGTGTCSYGINPNGYPQLFLYKGGTPLWRGGSWTGRRWSGAPNTLPNLTNLSFVDNQDEVTAMYGVTDSTVFTRVVLDESGTLHRLTWNDNKWVEFWSFPEECDTYRECGPNSNCNPYEPDKFRCTCLPGLEPNSTRDWNMRVGSGGCLRKQLGASMCRSGEGFVKLVRVKVPDTSMARVDMSLSLQECEQECLRNCSCMAYSSAEETVGGIGCLSWHGDLLDIRTYSNAGQDLFVRVDAAVLGILLYFGKCCFRNQLCTITFLDL
jgi:hypothetical protein